MRDIPPPYSAHDPHNSISEGTQREPRAPSPVRTSLRGGYLRGVPYHEDLSAASYFEERDFSYNQHLPLIILDRVITPATGRDDLPFPNLHAGDRDFTEHDWQKFVSYVLTELGNESDKGKARERKSKKTAIEFEDCKRNIESIVAEWNEGFFGPRSIRFSATYNFGAPSTPEDKLDSRAEGSNIAASVMSREPLSRGHSHDQGHGHRRDRGARASRRRSSSTSSSSSSSSDSSISSLSSDGLEGANVDHVRQALASFRLDPTNRRHVKSAVRQLHRDLRAESKRTKKETKGSRHNRAEVRATKKEIKASVKGLLKEARTLKRAEKRQRKADRQFRKAERKARRHGLGSARSNPEGTNSFYQAHAPTANYSNLTQERGVINDGSSPTSIPPPYPQEKPTNTFSEKQPNASSSAGTSNYAFTQQQAENGAHRATREAAEDGHNYQSGGGMGYGARAENYLEGLTRNLDSWGQQLERNMERWAGQLERLVEEKGKEVERRLG